jgi:hypothetical protein
MPLPQQAYASRAGMVQADRGLTPVHCFHRLFRQTPLTEEATHEHHGVPCAIRVSKPF